MTFAGYIGEIRQLEQQDRHPEAFEMYRRGAQLWPHHAFFTQSAYFNLKEKQRDPAAARAYLEQAERDEISERWVYNFVRGVEARTDGDRSEADRFFGLALEQGGNFDAFQVWIDNRLRLLAAQGADIDDRYVIIRQGIDWGHENRSDAALRHIGGILSDEYEAYDRAQELFRAAYEMDPSPEAAQSAFGNIGNRNFDAGMAVLEQGLREFPNNYFMLLATAWAWTDFKFDPQKADALIRRAVSSAPTHPQLGEAIRDYAALANRAAQYDQAVPIFEQHLSQTQGGTYRDILGYYIDNRFYGRDFSQANLLLELAKDYGGFSETWIAGREARIRTALQLRGQRDRFYAKNPFLNDWEQRFGEGLRVAIEFDTGKADIREESYGVLDRAAEALGREGAENYVFLIEGHTDSIGADTVNLPLSKARATAVERYFVEKSGIAPERLQTVGYGPRSPLASNDTDAGRQTNRRVEVRPYGNITAPRIATSGWLDARCLDLTPDGRFAVTGHTPAQVWDLERMVRVHQLPMGGCTREISPNGRYIAVKSEFLNLTGTTDNNLYVYDMRTGLVHSQIPHPSDVHEISWSPFSDAVAFTDRYGFLRVFDLASRSERVTKMDTPRATEEMTWVGTGDHIVTKVPRTQHAVVRDARTLRPVQTLHDAGWMHSMISTHDGFYLVGMNNSYEMVVWRTSDWTEVLRRRMPTMARLRAHPTEQKVMIIDNFNNETRLALVDVRSGHILAQLKGVDRKWALLGDFTPDGRHYVATIDGEIVYFETARLQIDRRKTGEANMGQGLNLVDGSDLLLSRDTTGTSVWSMKTGRQVHRIRGEAAFSWHPLSSDGTVLFSFDKDGRMHRFDATTFRSEVVLQVDGRPYSVSENDTHIVVGTVPEGDGPFHDPQAEIHMIEKSTLNTVMHNRLDIVSEPTGFSDIYHPRVFVRLADNGLVAVTSAWMAGYSMGITDGRVVTVYDPAAKGRAVSFQAEARYFDMSWEDGGDELWFRGEGRWYVHDPRTGKLRGRNPPDPSYEIVLDDGRTLEWNWDRVALDGSVISFPYNLRHLEVHDDRNVAVGQTTSNQLVFLDLNAMKLALTIVPRADGEWIAYTPGGHYSASLNGTEGAYWSLGDNYLPFSALSEQYERPGLIRRLMEAIARGEALHEDGPNLEADVFEAPYELHLVSPARTTTREASIVLTLEVEKSDADLAHPEIEYTLNGRRVLKSRGFREEILFSSKETVRLTRRFDLKPGRNVINVSLVWRDARIKTKTVEVVREDAVRREQLVSGRTLWFFGVGVSDYERSSQSLKFAHRDAQELAAQMEAQEGGLFAQVKTKILTNADATERNVRIEMNEFLGQSDPDDVVVLFLAGHGVVDDQSELYFMTYEGDLGKPYTGMGIDRFRDYLENRPLNQNAVLLLDICHSGAGGQRVVAEDAVQSLTKGTGAVVFASSSGSELSFEDESFGGGHGAFTAALLEGLRGMADNRVGNRDGLNSLQELVVFTSSRVPELTEGQQRPQIPPLALNLDYPLSRTEN